jgi:putative colanic acid biosysnthesis UDP-glucose lipid carrier transferase
MNTRNPLPDAKKAYGISLARDHILNITEALLDPLIMVFTLWGVGIYAEGGITPPYIVLSLILFFLTFPSSNKVTDSPFKTVRNTLFTWTILACLILAFGITTRYITMFPHQAVVTWLWLTPMCQIIAMLVLRKISPKLIKIQGPTKRAIIAGMNNQGLLFAEKLANNEYSSVEFLGFFDDRISDRTDSDSGFPILGKLNDLAEYANSNDVSVIYLSLPMASQPRILKLLDDLKDTTASLYFVPDMFMTDLIQGRMDQVDGIPVVAVRESPFTGFDGLIKRLGDLFFAIIILILIFPILVIIAIAVKLSSPGPIIFKQRRYGLDGKEIRVYKFRSMRTTEDGEKVTQATKDDARITKVGAFIRKTSLDELPQFFNVLQGRMSIVGPRPHAVAHNELYRKLIKGYMIRHKVKPGITGWAQVNGLRGETDTVEKMKLRIDYDIEYLRHWSTKLDTYIIFKTVWVVLRGQDNAY